MTTHYLLCGLKVASELPLPELLPWLGDAGPADVEIALGDVPPLLEEPRHVGPFLQTSQTGKCRYEIADVAAYLVEDGRRVTVAPRVSAETPAVRVFLLGSVFGLLCHQRGLLPLHAGCVEIDGKAVAFAGHSGAGKSTLAAAFLRRGFTLLADDVTVIDLSGADGPMVLPSFPRIKLWRDTMDAMGMPYSGLERVRPEVEKFQLPIDAGFGRGPLPLGAVSHLKTAKDYRHTGARVLSGSYALSALLDAVYRRMSAFRIGRREAVLGGLMQILEVPNIELTRVMEMEQLDATVSHLADCNRGPLAQAAG
jgi:hypothetical protein